MINLMEEKREGYFMGELGEDKNFKLPIPEHRIVDISLLRVDNERYQRGIVKKTCDINC